MGIDKIEAAKRKPNKTRHNPDRASQSAVDHIPQQAALPQIYDNGGPQAPSHQDPRVDVCELLRDLAERAPHGYTRITHDLDCKTWFVAFRWTHGPFAGAYVLASVPPEQLALGVVYMRNKVIEVEAGLRRPTPDRYALGRQTV